MERGKRYDEEFKKKKLNNKIIIKSKNQLLDENEKLKEENSNLKSLNYQYETQYNDLKEKLIILFIT